MKHKTNIITLIVMVLVAVNGIAQTKLTASEQKDFKTKVLQTAKSTLTIVSDFKQTKHLSVLNNTIASEGKLVFKAPNLVKWEYITPFQNTAIFKDEYLLVSNEGKKDKIDLSSNKLFKSLNTLIISSIKGDMFDDTQFEITYYKIDQGYLAKFIPKDKRMKKFIAAFELRFSKATAEVEEVKLIEPNADYTLITFQNRKANTKVTEADFNY